MSPDLFTYETSEASGHQAVKETVLVVAQTEAGLFDTDDSELMEDISEDFFCFNKLVMISVEKSIQLLLLFERKNVEEIFSVCTYYLFH